MDRVSYIYRVLSGVASEVEKQELEDWIAMNPENKEEFENIRLLWESEQHTKSVSSQESDRDFEKLNTLIKQQQVRKKRIRAYLYALIILILTLIGMAWLNRSGQGLPGYRFDEVALKNVIAVLESRYDIQIEVPNPELLQCLYSGSFFRTKQEGEVLRAMEQVLDVTFVALTDTQYKLVKNAGATDKDRNE
ncbi:MAG: DUF4974 domain-containing protein [Cyclobacteriaceae bacterium]|nr:DUF4974 domain-containing protein [Cyclobacteriaceae bacterium]